MEDEHMMREYLREGDLISAEVQNVQNDGSLSLHTRSLRYGKVSKCKNHSVTENLVTYLTPIFGTPSDPTKGQTDHEPIISLQFSILIVL